MTLSVRVKLDHEVVYETWALNEATVEKASRERMLEVVIEVDGRPLSRWGCDGVVCSTPTGSTAYNFSAGGPIVWPSVDALLLVPISAHALFARPLVVAPTSVATNWLQGKHTIFGEVTDPASQKVVDALNTVPTDNRDRPKEDVVIEKIDIEKL